MIAKTLDMVLLLLVIILILFLGNAARDHFNTPHCPPFAPVVGVCDTSEWFGLRPSGDQIATFSTVFFLAVALRLGAVMSKRMAEAALARAASDRDLYRLNDAWVDRLAFVMEHHGEWMVERYRADDLDEFIAHLDARMEARGE